MTPRFCYYIPHDAKTEDGYVPSMVVENEPGHHPMTGQCDCQVPWFWGHTREEAEAIARHQNARLGLSPGDASEIVASSMFAKLGERMQ